MVDVSSLQAPLPEDQGCYLEEGGEAAKDLDRRRGWVRRSLILTLAGNAECRSAADGAQILTLSGAGEGGRKAVASTMSLGCRAPPMSASCWTLSRRANPSGSTAIGTSGNGSTEEPNCMWSGSSWRNLSHPSREATRSVWLGWGRPPSPISTSWKRRRSSASGSTGRPRLARRRCRARA